MNFLDGFIKKNSLEFQARRRAPSGPKSPAPTTSQASSPGSAGTSPKKAEKGGSSTAPQTPLVFSDSESNDHESEPQRKMVNTMNCSKFCTFNQGCDCAANWLILANFDPNFFISEISVNQVRKCFPAWGVRIFTIQKQPCKCHNYRRFLRI